MLKAQIAPLAGTAKRYLQRLVVESVGFEYVCVNATLAETVTRDQGRKELGKLTILLSTTTALTRTCSRGKYCFPPSTELYTIPGRFESMVVYGGVGSCGRRSYDSRPRWL
jgi:hypothetical protein